MAKKIERYFEPFHELDLDTLPIGSIFEIEQHAHTENGQYLYIGYIGGRRRRIHTNSYDLHKVIMGGLEADESRVAFITTE